jgi:NAD(P)H-dependent flavin oxidoreductase YrpB (nitropropane dioxygenase family)
MGTIATMVLTPEAVAVAGETPVLAAGGIAPRSQMVAALALGAAGVWRWSVWLASYEDVTPLAVKRKLLAASAADTVRSRTRTGKPARQLQSPWHDAWDEAESPDPPAMHSSRSWSMTRGSASTPPPKKATRAPWSFSRSSTARWSAP